jgi:hypothetical protein
MSRKLLFANVLVICGTVLQAAGLAAPQMHDQSSITADVFGLDQFVDGEWVLRIDRAVPVISLGLTRHSQDVDGSEYRSISEGSAYPIIVSDHGVRVEIEGKKRPAVRPPMQGVRASATEPLVYSLDGGTFAGGRFVVWSGKDGLEGELTIYGAGVPIISSERGSISSSSRQD